MTKLDVLNCTLKIQKSTLGNPQVNPYVLPFRLNLLHSNDLSMRIVPKVLSKKNKAGIEEYLMSLYINLKKKN
jgi:hypothetical protein